MATFWGGRDEEDRRSERLGMAVWSKVNNFRNRGRLKWFGRVLTCKAIPRLCGHAIARFGDCWRLKCYWYQRKLGWGLGNRALSRVLASLSTVWWQSDPLYLNHSPLIDCYHCLSELVSLILQLPTILWRALIESWARPCALSGVFCWLSTLCRPLCTLCLSLSRSRKGCGMQPKPPLCSFQQCVWDVWGSGVPGRLWNGIISWFSGWFVQLLR